MKRFISLFVLLFTLLPFYAQNNKVIAVSVVNKGAEPKYAQMLQAYFESLLTECGYSVVEYSDDFAKGIGAYDHYVSQNSMVSEDAFMDLSGERLADSVCVLTLSKLDEQYQIRFTKVKYGQTNSGVIQIYPKMGDPQLILTQSPEKALQIALFKIIERLNLLTPEQKTKKARFQENLKKNDKKAIAASTFIPGLGQMLKGQYGAGCGFLFGELALFGGGTACYFLENKQTDIMSKRGISYDDYITAKNNKQTYKIAMYCCFATGAALHIANMCHAYCCRSKRMMRDKVFLEPSIIPINDYANINYALGVKVQYNF